MARKYKKLRTSKDLNRLMTRYYTKSKIIGKSLALWHLVLHFVPGTKYQGYGLSTGPKDTG